MTISTGTRFDHYEILSKLGAGGMGEVHLAQDLRLGRKVALKLLPAQFIQDKERLRRFEQEARAVSALNHPNIITIYEIGVTDNIPFLASEFIEGETLRQRMANKEMKLREVLDVASQVASALVAAHTVGIVHRDIKPENIMLRRDGYVKVLDFGLAKLTEQQPLNSVDREAPTRAPVNTDPGVVMGTVAYMSPEQATGREVDARTDIWSLSVVLYEMITRHLPFEGPTPSHTIVAITDREPLPLWKFAPETPDALGWLVAEALTKDREERIQTAREMLGKLRRLKQHIESGSGLPSGAGRDRSISRDSNGLAGNRVIFGGIQSTPDEATRSAESSGSVETIGRVFGTEYVVSEVKRYKNGIALTLSLGVVVILAITLGTFKLFPRGSSETHPAKMNALTTSGRIGDLLIDGALSISPDGKYIACAALDAGQQSSLWVRQISTSSVLRVVPPGKGTYIGTTFSPDGEFIYYVAVWDRNPLVPSLFRVSVLGGAPAKVLEHVYSPITFSPDGKQFGFVRRNQPQGEDLLLIANTDGAGEPKVIASRKQPEFFSPTGPSWSPDGKRIACGAHTASPEYATVIDVPVDGGTMKPISNQKWADVRRIAWLPDGSGLIMAAIPEFSSVGTQVWLLEYPGGKARRITNDLNAYGSASLSLTADSGTIATIQTVEYEDIWLTAPNEDEGLGRPLMKANLIDTLCWTSDGRILYPTRVGENWDIWMINADGSGNKQLTADAFIDKQASASPDGRYIIFESNRSGNWNIWRLDFDGGNLKQLTEGSATASFPVCSLDGRWVIFKSFRSGKPILWKTGIDGGAPVQLSNLPYNSFSAPSISPDGTLIAFEYFDEEVANQPKLAIIPFEGGDPVKVVDLSRTAFRGGGLQWMPDGRSVAYVESAGIQNIFSQPVDGGPPKQLTKFKSKFIGYFALSRDGKQIAVSRITETNDIVLIKGFL